jgi:Mn2+/Fe2+ NRAMP family transporter
MEKTNAMTAPPRGWRRLLFLGPGLVWAASSVGVAELVFATRAGALFGLVLLWAPLVSLFFKFFVTELVGRYTIASGENVVRAFARVEVKIGPLRLPPGWILWLFWILFAASVAGMSGIALAVGSCLTALFPFMPCAAWSVAALLAVGAILVLGSYRALEWAARVLVAVMIAFTVYSVINSAPGGGELLAGLVPRAPAESLRELIPLLGWTGAGAIGTIWFSLWTQGSGRGAASSGDSSSIKGWISVNRLDLALNTVVTAVLTVGFLIAGAAILRPQGLVPHGEDMGTVLAKIAGVSMGRMGEAVFLVGVFGTLFSTLLADIDGLCRVAVNSMGKRPAAEGAQARRYRFFLLVYVALAGAFAVVITAPVVMLQLTAVVDTVLLPVVALLAVRVCRQFLPRQFHPGRFSMAMVYASAVFFSFFIVLLIGAAARGVKFGL